jgi:FkbM family methyltransferase
MQGDDILCRALGRYKMIVYAGDHSLAPNLIADGFWEIWITAMIVKAVEPGMVCIDAGANIGYYTVIMADMASWAGKVIAAEPAPATFELLQKNARLNDEGHIELLNLAFGAEAGTASFFVPRSEPKNASFFERIDLAPAEVEVVDVRVMPIDALDLPRVDFVKIDVEGAERMVWNGMQQTIARSPDIQIVMEINAGRDTDIDSFLAEITALFPLRMVNYWGDPEPVTIAQIKSDPADVMLYLSRRTPSERKAASR